jgi:hypothetical protein
MKGSSILLVYDHRFELFVRSRQKLMVEDNDEILLKKVSTAAARPSPVARTAGSRR